MNKIKMLGMVVIAVFMVTFISCSPPRLSGTVSIEGDPMVGKTLTANIGSLGGSGIITYQWLRDGAIAVADTNEYTLQSADIGSAITVTVIRSDNSGSVSSSPVTPWGYTVGETGPGGGIIFYVDLNGFTMTDTGETAYFLEAAPANMTTALRWSATTNWQNPPNVAGTSPAIGTGRHNTVLILAVDATAPAALACRNFSNNGLSDWFLPSRDELNQLYRNRAVVGNLGTDFFWSSSQYDSRYAWYQDFVNGSQSGLTKGNYLNVRPVRAF